jgi:anti-sigma B factor antagonist
MEITVTQQGKVTIIAFVGAADATEADKIGATLDTQIKSGYTRLVADLSQLEFINSAGLRAFVQALKDSNRKGGDFRLASLQPRFVKVLEITGFTSLFKRYPTVAAAVASFGA